MHATAAKQNMVGTTEVDGGLSSTTPHAPPTHSSVTTSRTHPTPDFGQPANMKQEQSPLTLRTGNETTKKPNLATRNFSPCNENGCYDFDRVLQAGDVKKRARKTKQWKPIHLVLRPQTLSIYADQDGTKLRHRIQLSDVTAVARQRDPKKKERHVFALFTLSRKYHIEAGSESDAQKWVERIRRQARIDEEEDEIIALMSPTLERPPGIDSGFFGKTAGGALPSGHGGETSASEAETQPNAVRKSRSKNNMSSMHSARRSSVGLSYFSGAEQASYSDFSDNGGVYPESALSLPTLQTQAERDERARKVEEIYRPSAAQDTERPMNKRSVSAVSGRAVQPSSDGERVVYNGYLHMLKSKRGGVRQWKSVWAVLRGQALALYKNDEEYKPLYILSFGSIVDAVDIDNISKHKEHCFQVITDEKTFRFCAPGEDEVAQWVGGFKALLAKRREGAKVKDEEKRLVAEASTVVAPS